MNLSLINLIYCTICRYNLSIGSDETRDIGVDITFLAKAEISGDTGWFIQVKSSIFLGTRGSPIGIKTSSWMVGDSIPRGKYN